MTRRALRLLILPAAGCVLLAAGCGLDLASLLGFTIGTTPAPRLVRFTSAEELRAYLVEQSSGSFRGGGFAVALGEPDFDATNEAAPTAAPDGSAGAVGADDGDGGTVDEQSFSSTTEQEVGVQESDVIKNDGQYIYTLSTGALHIVEATDTGDLELLGKVGLSGTGSDLFLVGDRVVALTMPIDGGLTDPIVGPVDALFAPEYFQPRLEAVIIDVSDRTAPRIEATVRIDGSLSASRMIDERLYLVVSTFPDFIPLPLALVDQPRDGGAPDSGGSGSGGSGGDVPVELDDMLPDIAIAMDGEMVTQGNIADITDHFRPESPGGLGLTNIITLDIGDPSNYQAQSVVGYPSNVYVSPQALYLTDTDYSGSGALRETTDIYKFAFTNEGTTLSASGRVPGRVLNQYSMSEYNGFLRVATTIGRQFGPFGQSTPSTNNVYVLEQSGDSLSTAGSIEGLAPGESIFSARFLGDRGFLVTFVQVDPLFTIDLSDPRNPRVVGELKVPGFSTLILPMDDDHLLTIGRNTNDDFGRVFTDGIRLSVFDVSDFADPRLAHVEVIGGPGTSSEALFNPKAFTYLNSQDLVAFPIEIYNDGFFGGPVIDVEVFADDGTNASGDGSTGAADPDDVSTTSSDEPRPDDGDPVDPPTGDEPIPTEPVPPPDSFAGLIVYRATTDGGFEQLGKIDTRDASAGFFYAPPFTRGAFIDDQVYAISAGGVKSATVNDPDTLLDVVRFDLDDNRGDDIVPPLPEPAPRPL